MPGFFGCPSKPAEPERMLDSLDLVGTCDSAAIRLDDVHFAVGAAWLRGAPLRSSMRHVTDTWVGLFSGDLVGREKVPWEELIAGVEEHAHGPLRALTGVWAVCLIDKRRSRLYLISDRRSQHPVYYKCDADGIWFSTELVTLARGLREVSFNREWLWDLLFFNYPIGDTTPIQCVRRLPPASIVEYEFPTRSVRVREYADRFRMKDRLLGGDRALRRSFEVLSEQIPKHFAVGMDTACALTAGWDTRTVLALSPERPLLTYTYGLPGCRDISAAGRIAERIGAPHLKIHLAGSFESKLPSLAFDAVYLSSGHENPARASVLHAFQTLTDCGKQWPIIVSGISLDSLFRGHAAVPSYVSIDGDLLLRGQDLEPRLQSWKDVVRDHDDFVEHIRSAVRYLTTTIGDLRRPESHMSFWLYEADPKYFCGEWALAKNYSTLRVPAWDPEVIELAFSSELSMLSFSEFLPHHKRGAYEEKVLQAYILCHGPRPVLGRIPVGDVSPKTILRGKAVYRAQALSQRALGFLRTSLLGTRTDGSAENWTYWFGSLLRERIDRVLFAEDARVREFLQPQFVEWVRHDLGRHSLKRLLQAEVTVRLLENRWQRFW